MGDDGNNGTTGPPGPKVISLFTLAVAAMYSGIIPGIRVVQTLRAENFRG